MRILRRVPALLVLLLLAACEGDALAPGSLLGDWLLRTETPADEREWYRHDLRLTLRGDGTYTWESRSWADWGREGDGLLGYGQNHGRYAVRGDSLYLTSLRTVAWDHVSGQETLREQEEAAGRFHVTVAGSRLVLDYVSAPADEPQPTRIVFRRD